MFQPLVSRVFLFVIPSPSDVLNGQRVSTLSVLAFATLAPLTVWLLTAPDETVQGTASHGPGSSSTERLHVQVRVSRLLRDSITYGSES